MLRLTLRNLIELARHALIKRGYWNFLLFEKNASAVNTIGTLHVEEPHGCAMVIQGPLLLDDQFTLESLRLYRRFFPDAILILSTWEIPTHYKALLDKINVNYIENVKPNNPGISNINMQIQTTRSGFLLAKDLGAVFAVKTRTDQRIYNQNLFSGLYAILNVFPVSGPTTKSLHYRLIGCSMNTFKYRMYGLSDMFLFGHIDDVLLYWDIPFDFRVDSPEERLNDGSTWRSFALWRVTETYLCTEFLKKIGYHPKFTLVDSFVTFSKFFIIVDHELLKIFWEKYTYNQDRYANFGIADPQLRFTDWLQMYRNPTNISYDETMMDRVNL